MLTLDKSVDFFEGLMPGTPAGGYWQTFEKLLPILRRKHSRVCFAEALALSAHGVVRTTQDIDLLVHPEERDLVISESSGPSTSAKISTRCSCSRTGRRAPRSTC